MVVRPDDGLDIAAPDAEAAAIGVEDRGDVRPGRHLGGGLDERHNPGRIVFPVATDTQIEHDVAVAVGDEEAVDGSVDAVEAVELGLPEELGVQVEKIIPGERSVSLPEIFSKAFLSRWNSDVRVDDPDIHSRRGIGDLEVWRGLGNGQVGSVHVCNLILLNNKNTCRHLVHSLAG